MLVTDITATHFPTPSMIRGEAPGGGSPHRSPGLHLSTIYNDIETGTHTKGTGDFGPEELAWFRAGGLLWERVFSSAMAESIRGAGAGIVRPGEFLVDGIIGSPDNIRASTLTVIETKCTWKSIRKFDHLEKYFWVWLVQMKGYCKMMGVEEAELYVFFVMGDYKGSGPQGRAIRLQWSRGEIEDNWRMLLNHARKQGWLPRR